MLRKKRKKILSFTLGITLLILLFILSLFLQPYTFERGFSELEKIDQKYGAAYQQEKLNVTMIPLENADAMILDLEDLKRKWQTHGDTHELKALRDFTDIRIHMIKSEKNFQLGKQIGNIGIVTDAAGFRCTDKPYLLNAAYYYNRSWTYGVIALHLLDQALYDYRNVTNFHELAGINLNKTLFYKSPLSVVKHFSTDTLHALARYCNYDTSQPLQLQRTE